MNGKNVGLIYFYLVSASSLALIVIGIFSLVNYGINITQYEQYPLKYRGEQDCENMFYGYGKPYPAQPMIDTPAQSSPSAEEIEQRIISCKDQMEIDRKTQKLDDIKNALTFTIIGSILFAIHYPQARKQSKA